MKSSLYWLIVLYLFCLTVVYYIDLEYRVDGADPWRTLLPRVLAISTCYISSLFGLMLTSETLEKKNPVASVLLGILIRMMVLLGALGVVTATKWSYHNLFTSTLVGCYFSFLALESCLSIKRIHSRI